MFIKFADRLVNLDHVKCFVGKKENDTEWLILCIFINGDCYQESYSFENNLHLRMEEIDKLTGRV